MTTVPTVPPLRRVVQNEIRTHAGRDRVVQHLDCGHIVGGYGIDPLDGQLPFRRRCSPCLSGQPPGEARRRQAVQFAPKSARQLVGPALAMRDQMVSVMGALGAKVDEAPSAVVAHGRGRFAEVRLEVGSGSVNVTACADLGIRGIADARRWARELATELGVPYRDGSRASRRKFRLRIVEAGADAG